MDNKFYRYKKSFAALQREKCPNTELFPVRIFLYLDWIKYGPEIT